MNTPVKIGVTGGIGSGKSLVCRIFALLGVPVYDADSRAKTIMTTDGIVVSAIKKEFGELSFNPDQTLNRAYLAGLIFADPERRAALNRIVHPRVHEDFERWANAHKDSRYVIEEAALLLEGKGRERLNSIVVVDAPEELRIQRVLQRDRHRSRADVERIIKSQMRDDERRGKADFVIVNDETCLVLPQVLTLHRHFSAEKTDL